MKRKVEIYAYSWDKESLLVSFDKVFNDYTVHLGQGEVLIDDTIFPSDEKFKRLKHENDLKVAEDKVYKLKEELDGALDELKTLQAITYKG